MGSIRFGNPALDAICPLLIPVFFIECILLQIEPFVGAAQVSSLLPTSWYLTLRGFPRWMALLQAGLLVWLGLWLATGAQAATPFEDSMAQRTLACTACHGPQGKAGPEGYYPRLAGKPADYLYNQLINFRTERRHYPLMSGLLGTLDDNYLHAIADHFATLSVPYPPPHASTASADEMQLGQRLVQQGERARGIPACTQCHGEQLTGLKPATPGLLGLPADYLIAQLGGWQTGQRHAAEPDCMAKVVQQLNAKDISAMARWLAAQKVPDNAHPAERRPPRSADADAQAMRCGSDTAAAAPALPAANPNVDAALVARGAYLARVGNCMLCHTAVGGMAYGGGRPQETPFGAVLSRNITPDPQYGIGTWSADDFWQALHHGLSKDGSALYPAFPYTSYTQVSRADSDALFAYLKTLAPAPQPNKAHTLRWPFSTQLSLRVWRTLFFKPYEETGKPAAAGTATAQDAALERGRYLVQGLGHCLECHGKRNVMGALSNTPGEGGSVLPGQQWIAPSLSDPAGASVVAWSEADIRSYLQTGRNSQAQARGPMAEAVLHGLQYLSDPDALAIARYLKTLPQQKPQPPAARAVVSSATLTKGGKLYESYCADCHGKDGRGRADAYPALVGNRSVLQEPPNNLINTVLGGAFAPATPGHPRPFGMPPFVLQMRDADMAAVLSYIRNAWGNQALSISEFDINKFRRMRASDVQSP